MIQHKDDVTGNTSKMFTHTNLCGNKKNLNAKIPTQNYVRGNTSKMFYNTNLCGTDTIQMSKIQHKSQHKSSVVPHKLVLKSH